MSQEGVVDIIGTHPEIPTEFIANIGSAIPIGNQLEILGTTQLAGTSPLHTTGSGNTITIINQLTQASGSSAANMAGLGSFNSADFSVDANGYVSLSGSFNAITNIAVDANTAPGTNPVVPTAMGQITITGGQVATGVIGTNVVRTDSLAANAFTIQIQRSTSAASTNVALNGVSHYDSAVFTIDANAFVSLSGTAVGKTITGNSGGALSPTAGNWNILGASVAAGTTPVATAGSVSTLTVNVQKAQAIASTNATNVGLSAYNSTDFTVDANGFVTLQNSALGVLSVSGTVDRITSTGGQNPVIDIAATYVGQTSITTLGTITTGVWNGTAVGATFGGTGQTTYAAGDMLYASAINTLSKLSATTNTFVLTLSGGLPVWAAPATSGTVTTLTGNSGGAISPTAGNINTLGTGSITIVGSGSTLTTQLTGLTNHNVLLGAGTATITNLAPSATSGVPLISQGASSDPAFGTAVVAGGGTGNTTFTAYSVILAGTTATGAFQNVLGVGTALNILYSGGAGQLPYWDNGPSQLFRVINQVFTSSAYYTPTVGMLYCLIRCVGGGGGGGGSATCNAAQFAAAAGGGSGEYAEGVFTSASIGVSAFCTIGAAGASGAAGNHAGGTGGTTSVAALISAVGGAGGAGGPAGTGGTTSGGGGGSGGTGGDLHIGGSGGGPGFNLVTPACLIGGAGAASLLGGWSGQAVGGAGGTGTNYGSGGGGASTINNGTQAAGGAGGTGFVIITEYIL